MDPALTIAYSAIGMGALSLIACLVYGRRLSRSPQDHPVGRRLFPLLKWPLVALGAYVLIGSGIQSLSRKEVGLGVAFLVYLGYHAFWMTVRTFGRHHADH